MAGALRACVASQGLCCLAARLATSSTRTTAPRRCSTTCFPLDQMGCTWWWTSGVRSGTLVLRPGSPRSCPALSHHSALLLGCTMSTPLLDAPARRCLQGRPLSESHGCAEQWCILVWGQATRWQARQSCGRRSRWQGEERHLSIGEGCRAVPLAWPCHACVLSSCAAEAAVCVMPRCREQQASPSTAGHRETQLMAVP